MADFDKISIDRTYYNVKDTTARQQISDETTAREQADSQLSQQISAETTARERADSSLQSSLDDLESVGLKTILYYGATPGASNDCAQAINQSIAEQGLAIIPPGTFGCSGVTLGDGESIIGCGFNVSALVATSTNPVITIKDSFNSVVRGILINGNHTAQRGISANTVNGLVLENLYILNTTAHGILLSTAKQSNTYRTCKISKVFVTLCGTSGISISNIPDVSISDCDIVSNCQNSQDGTANLAISNSAVKCVNTHIWNLNDSFGKVRPKVCLMLAGSASDCEFTNCHIEGASENNISISTKCSRNTFVNCMIYASFGPTSIWNAGWNTRFIGCTLLGQAADDVAKPTWDSIMSGAGGRMIMSNCYCEGQIVAVTFEAAMFLGIFTSVELASAIPSTLRGSSFGYGVQDSDGTAWAYSFPSN